MNDITVNNKNEYLRFSAESIKELLQQKLTENTNFTDQAFPGSVIDILLDAFAQMYAAQLYYLNNTASEAMFTDANLYENMNRIVKMLGYNPTGYITASLPMRIRTKTGVKLDNEVRPVIHRYTSVITDLKTSKFKAEPVAYSFAAKLDQGYAIALSGSRPNDTPMYNGKWTLYPMQETSYGIPFETVILDNLDISESSPTRDFMSHDHIDVYVQTSPTSKTYENYATRNSLFDSLKSDKHVELRLNENKQYVLRFGDGVHAARIPRGCDIRVIYLKSNGSEGVVGPEAFPTTANQKVLKFGVDGLSISELTDMLDITSRDFMLRNDKAHLGALYVTTDTLASAPSEFETVDVIRANAPNWFRMGSRLITYNDFGQFVKGSFPQVRDVTVHNNWDYLVEFQEWIRNYDKLSPEIRKRYFTFADSCDFNNIYLWVKNASSADNKRDIQEKCAQIKCLTSELVIHDPVNTFYSPVITKHNLEYVTEDTFLTALSVGDQEKYAKDVTAKMAQIVTRFGYSEENVDDKIKAIPVLAIDNFNGGQLEDGVKLTLKKTLFSSRSSLKNFIYEGDSKKLVSWFTKIRADILKPTFDIEREVSNIFTSSVPLPDSNIVNNSVLRNAMVEIMRNIYVTYNEVIRILNRQYVQQLNNYRNSLFMDSVVSSYIEITRNKHSLITTERIRRQAADVFVNFFTVSNAELGMKIDIAQIHSDILAIDGVNNVKTVTLEKGESGKVVRNEYDGISLGAWTNDIIEKRDKRNVSENEKIKNFQFPILYLASQFDNKIQVVQDDYLVTGVEY